jgi:hypothetical protein
MMNHARCLFLTRSALEYSARIHFMAELAGEDWANPDFILRTVRDISIEAVKLNDDLERLKQELAKEIKPAAH